MNEHAICIRNYGDVSVLNHTAIELDLPLPNEVQIRHYYSGINYADIYFRNGVYKLPIFPAILGIEGVGIIESLGDTVLVQAAAGGLGLVLVQWIKALGGHVIGTVGSSEKAELVRAHGVDHAILYREEDFVTAISRITDDQGVDYAIDGIGGKTLFQSLQTIRPGGVLASIGQVAEPVDELKMKELSTACSVKFVRPSVMGFIKDNDNYRAGAEATIERLRKGLQVKIDDILPLSQAALAHERLEAGKTSGSLLLDTND